MEAVWNLKGTSRKHKGPAHAWNVSMVCNETNIVLAELIQDLAVHAIAGAFIFGSARIQGSMPLHQARIASPRNTHTCNQGINDQDTPEEASPGVGALGGRTLGLVM